MELGICTQQNNSVYNPAFKGINKIMKKRLYQTPEFLESLTDVYTRENGNVGTLPNDLLKLIGLKGNKAEDSRLVKSVQSILNNTNGFLSQLETKKLEVADNLNIKNFINAFLPKLAKIEIQPKRIVRILNEMRRRLTPQADYIDSISDAAGKYIETNFKQLGILSEKDKVKVTYLDQGKFKNAFKLEFLNKDNENIIHPKVLLSFKDKTVANEQFNKIIGILKQYYTNIPEKEYISTIMNVLNNASKKVVPPEQKGLYYDVLRNLFNEIKFGNGEEKFTKILDETILKELKFNGTAAESNITQYIKHAAGSPLEQSDFVPVYYLNLKHNIALAEFSDDLLPPPRHRVNLYKYGVFHDDIETNKNNVVADRVIDYGNIKPLPNMKRLRDNPIIRRYYHKISQIKRKDPLQTQRARIQYWNNLYSLASENRIPNHNDVLLALQESKSFIEPQHWHRLLDSESETLGNLL